MNKSAKKNAWHQSIRGIQRHAKEEGLFIRYMDLPPAVRTIRNFRKVVSEGIMLKKAGFGALTYPEIKAFAGSPDIQYAKLLGELRNEGAETLQRRLEELRQKIDANLPAVKKAKAVMKIQNSREFIESRRIIREHNLWLLERNAIEEELNRRKGRIG